MLTRTHGPHRQGQGHDQGLIYVHKPAVDGYVASDLVVNFDVQMCHCLKFLESDTFERRNLPQGHW